MAEESVGTRDAATGADRTDPPRPTSGPGRRVTRRRPPIGRADALAAVAIIAQLIWRGVLVARSVPRQDDFLLAAEAHRRGLSVIFDDYHGHIQATGWIIALVANRMAPLQQWPLATITIVLQATASVLGWLALRRLVGPRLAALPALALLLFSPLTVGPLLWSAAAVQMLILQIAIFGGILAHERAVCSGTSQSTVVAWGVLAAALLCNEKALVVPVLLLALGFAQSWRSQLRSLTRDRTLWLGYLFLGIGELLLYLSITRGEHFEPTANDHVLLTDGFAGTWLPQITAVPIHGDLLPPLLLRPPISATVMGAIAALLVVLVACARTGLRALRLALLLIAYVAADYAIVAVARLGFGSIIAVDPRYIADTVPVAAVCLALALSTQQGDVPLQIGRLARATRPRRRGWPLVAVLLVGAYAVVAVPVTSATATAARRAGDPAYVSTIRQQLSGRNLTLVDSLVPDDVISGLFGAQARVSELTSVLPGRRRFAGLTDHPQMIDSTGRLRSAAPGPGSVEIRGPEPGCGWSVLYGRQTSVELPPSLKGQPGIVRIGYVLGSDTPVVVDLAGVHVAKSLRAGLGYLNVVVQDGADEITLDGVAPGVRLCVSDITAGPAAPT